MSFILTHKHMQLHKKIHKRGLSNGCHDLMKDELAVLTAEEWKEFIEAYKEWDGCLDEEITQLPDYAVYEFILHSLYDCVMSPLGEIK